MAQTGKAQNSITTLGIDPGSRLMGFGLVSKSGTSLKAHAHGTLRFNTKIDTNSRLLEIYVETKRLVQELRPTHVAVEKIFFAKNVVSALKLGAARGVALLAVTEAGIPIFEYSPNEVKQATTGFGHADKSQVAKMMSLLLGAENFESSDASDALAIAICHLHTHGYKSRLERANL